jgi:hypothetical protein
MKCCEYGGRQIFDTKKLRCQPAAADKILTRPPVHEFSYNATFFDFRQEPVL